MERLELKEVQILEGHNDRVWSLDWDLTTGHAGIPLVFASCSGDKTVRIWEQNLSTGLFSCKLHAKEVARSLDVTEYDGIVCVNGDGIFVEVVNELLQREDWNTAIKMPLVVVPAGLVADVDIESKKYRWMGSADFYGKHWYTGWWHDRTGFGSSFEQNRGHLTHVY